MDTILITGGAGFIGSTLANFYGQKNKVIVIDNLSMGNRGNLNISENIHFIEGDVTDHTFIQEILKKNEFDYIFHLAAIASVADSVERPMETHEVNFMSVFQLLEDVRNYQLKLKRFIFSSSAAVYGDEPTLPKSEEAIIRPLTPYAIDKFAAEKYVLTYNNLYHVPTTAVRFFNVYGPKQNPKSPYSGVISIIMDNYKKVINKESSLFTVFGNGKQARDFVYIEDVIQALDIVAHSEASLGRVYNVGTGVSTDITKLIHVLDEIIGSKLVINYQEERLGDIKYSLANIDALRSLGYEPQFDIVAGLKEYVFSELDR